MSENTKGLMEKFLQLHAMIARYVHHTRRENEPQADPHRGQGRVLRLLKMQQEISQKDLSYLLDIRPQSLGELLGKLERSELIIKTPSEEDRRIMMITLTEAGKAAAEQVTEQKLDMDNLFSCLSQEEQESLSVLLSRLCDHLSEQLGKEEPSFDREHCHHHGFHHRGESPMMDDRLHHRFHGKEGF